MSRLLVVMVFLNACSQTPPPARPAPDLSGGGAFSIIDGAGGAKYVIDEKTESCFLLLPGTLAPGPVDCHKLAAAYPEAQKVVTWRKPATFDDALRAMETSNLPTVPPPPVRDSLITDEETVELFDDGIKQDGKRRWTIERSVIDAILEQPGQVARGARIVPSMKDGKPNGFKLYAIRPNSIYTRIGLMNGDTITTVNGHDLTTADKALEVYTRVRESDEFTVKIRRRGRDVTLQYRIE